MEAFTYGKTSVEVTGQITNRNELCKKYSLIAETDAEYLAWHIEHRKPIEELKGEFNYKVLKDNFYNSDVINIDGNYIHKTAVIYPNVKLGKGNYIGAYTVIGSNGEMRGVNQKDFKGFVSIGDNNVISEHVTIQRPYLYTATRVGNNNIIMAHSHIGHDAYIGNNCEICTGTIIGGYAVVQDDAKLKLGVTVRNRIVIGSGALVGLGSSVVKNVPKGATVYGNPAKPAS
jgi:UDP-3-O-[3-hydroxymyristoyl] glucosamine N-acyltransferase